MFTVASAYLFQNLLCACLTSYGPNVDLLHSSVPVPLYYLPGWGFSRWFRKASHCITHHLQVTWSHKQQSIAHWELQESASCIYMMSNISVTKSKDAVTTRGHWSRCIHRQPLQLLVPLSLNSCYSSHLEWICNYCVGLWVREGGRQVLKSAERSVSCSNVGCWAGCNMTP
jgi:hypothetical protein